MSETLSWDDFNMELFILSRSHSSSAEKLEAMDLLRASHEALRERVALLERVTRAARARREVWSRETYVEMDDALAAFDNQETGGAR